jgi:excisionase family DNA binding protein
MRSSFADRLLAATGNDLLTTGEAARLLNSSRQHVVDLCDRGDLPFTTVGTHRRVRRADVEALRTRTRRLSRDEQRSLWLAYAIAGRIVTDPDATIAQARRNLDRMRAASRGQASRWLDEWARVLDGPIDELLEVLTGTSPRSRELRQNSPFAGVLTAADRDRVLGAWRAEHRSRSR